MVLLLGQTEFNIARAALFMQDVAYISFVVRDKHQKTPAWLEVEPHKPVRELSPRDAAGDRFLTEFWSIGAVTLLVSVLMMQGIVTYYP